MPYVYIITNKPYGVSYTGFTNDLAARMQQHKDKVVDGFSKAHDLNLLAWFESHESIVEARKRELAIKRWRRDWKINLIQEKNPEWRDLSFDL
jgi:putative endonuclease